MGENRANVLCDVHRTRSCKACIALRWVWILRQLREWYFAAHSYCGVSCHVRKPLTTCSKCQGPRLRVRCAPPTISPLCCRNRLRGSTFCPYVRAVFGLGPVHVIPRGGLVGHRCQAQLFFFSFRCTPHPQRISRACLVTSRFGH